jgi:myo-inositol 2-dehydrogenase/D-chiro-inositol 1-dehydrogenase
MTKDTRVVNVAISGLGRIGRYHSMNIIKRIRDMNLVAGCSVTPEDVAWGKENLAPFGVQLYDNYEDMLKQGNIDAVLVAASTSVHAEQTISAIESGFHVFCEKPLATNIEDAEEVVRAAKKRPDLKVLCGFSRRFDDSYRDAKAKVDAGLIGKPYVFRSQTCDRQDETGFFVKYAAKSGGILVDCSIHDLDLALYFFGEDAEPKQMSAIGTAAIYPELNTWNDADNALALIKFHDGRLANFYASRMMTHGQEDTTEIIGTEGKITVNKNPQVNLSTISDRHGVRNEVPKDFYGRFEMAFVNELTAYAGYILNDQEVPFSLAGNVKVLRWAKLLQECLETGKSIDFDTQGRRLN